jgi:acyl carrier protein
MRDDIKKVLASVLGVKASQVRDDASVTTVEEWDSVKQIKLILALEERFGVQFDDDEIAELISLDAIEQALDQRQQKARI